MSCVWLSPEETGRVLTYLEERFGIPSEALSGHRLVRRGEYVCAVRREAVNACEALDWISAGLRLLRVSEGDRFKLSTRGAQVFGLAATTHMLDITEAELRALLQGQSLPSSSEPGLTILRHHGHPIGLSVVRAGHLVSQLPRSVTEHLRLGVPRPEPGGIGPEE